MRQKTLRLFCTLIFSLSLIPTWAQQQDTVSVSRQAEQVQKQTELLPETLKEKPVPVFCGIALTADLSGLGMQLFGADFAQMEASLRLNFKEKYFPAFELGYGTCDYVSEETYKRFSTKAPYLRIGMDYNFTKKRNGNRLYAGLRYGLSRYNYNMYDEGFSDPVWENETPFRLENEPATAHWAEALFGLETKLWSFLRVGWTLRYKLLLKHTTEKHGNPWYIPGFGKNSSSTCFGGTFNIIFNI